MGSRDFKLYCKGKNVIYAKKKKKFSKTLNLFSIN